MKKYSSIIIILISLFVFSCNSSTESETIDNLGKAGIYNLGGAGASCSVSYAEIDSLNNFHDIGVYFSSGYWLTAPDHFISLEYNLYVIATLNSIIFIDTKTNKIVKTASIDSSPIIDEYGSPGIIRFIKYKERYCLVAIQESVYFIDLALKRVNGKIFNGNNIDSNLQIMDANISFDKNYLYLIVMNVGPSLPQSLIKFDLNSYSTKNIADFSYDVGMVIDLGITKDFVICHDGTNIFKYSVDTDELIVHKTQAEYFPIAAFYPFENDNSLICLSSYPDDPSKFYLLDCENLVFSKYFEMGPVESGSMQQLQDGLYGIINDGEYYNIIKLSSLEIKNRFPKSTIMRPKIKEVLNEETFH